MYERTRQAGRSVRWCAQCCRYLDLNATPPFNYAHDHFGFRDRLSQPVIEGSGEEPTPGSGAPLKPGEFILGYPDEDRPPHLPQPDVLSRNGSYMAYRRLQEHVGLFRDYLREHADTPEGQELLAAKFMGRGAAVPRWCWLPNTTIPSWARTRCATTTSTTRRWTRTATRCRWAHTRGGSTRVTPR